MKEVYSQENILIPVGIEYAKFPIMAAPRVFVDVPIVFSTVA